MTMIEPVEVDELQEIDVKVQKIECSNTAAKRTQGNGGAKAEHQHLKSGVFPGPVSARLENKPDDVFCTIL